MYKRTASVLLAFAVILSLAACAGTPAEPAASGAAGPAASDAAAPVADANLTPEGEYPIVNEPLTLTYWVPLNEKYSSVLTSFSEMASEQEIEKNTNIHIEYQHAVQETANEQFNLMVASGNLPDIIEIDWMGRPGGPEKALADNVIIDLTELIDQHAPNYKKILAETPDGAAQSMTTDGRHYMMTGFYYGDVMAAKIMIGPQYRRDWFQNLGIADPVTIDDWHNALVAIRDGDANGNGDASDEIPFISKGAGITGATQFANDNINVFASGFGVFPTFYQVDDVIKFGAYEPEWKEYLMTMNQWYNEGLIDPEFATTDKTMFDAKIFGDQAGTWFCGLMGDMGRFVVYCDEDEPDWEIAALTYPVDVKSGKAYNFSPGLNNQVNTAGANITPANQHPVETTRWLDYFYTDEGRRLDANGVEGLTYELVDGEVQFTELITNNPNGWDITRAIAYYCRSAGTTGARMPDLALMNARASHPLQREARDVKWAEASIERGLPSLSIDEEFAQRQADILNEVYIYVEEMILKYITGVESFDNYDEYLATLEDMGIEEAIQIQQDTYDAFLARG